MLLLKKIVNTNKKQVVENVWLITCELVVVFLCFLKSRKMYILLGHEENTP